MRAFGVRDVDTGEPVTVHTLFHVASITETFTAAAVMQQVERERLSLSELKDADFNALGAAIASAAQQSYPQYMQSKVLAAAGMNESTFDAPRPGDNIAWPHTGKVFVSRASRYPWDGALLPSAGLNASIGDMTRWAAAHVNRDPALLSPTSYDVLFKRRSDSEGGDLAQGLGWQLEKRGDQWLPRHAGAEDGFSSLLTLYPAQRRAIVILSNGETTPHKDIRNLIETVLNGEPYVPLMPPPLLRRDFQWTLVGLLCMTALLIAVTVRFRRQPRR
jgi:CubicO group peptidase (beta-lactamase class C family)